MIAGLEGQGMDAHYLGFFECFNQGLYYEAHDVLEELWLPSRKGPNDAFYKGLIQLAGAFVHLQKERLKPSAALFNLARANLLQYPPQHEGIVTLDLLALTDCWLQRLQQADFTVNPFKTNSPPKLLPPRM